MNKSQYFTENRNQNDTCMIYTSGVRAINITWSLQQVLFLSFIKRVETLRSKNEYQIECQLERINPLLVQGLTQEKVRSFQFSAD